jgi:hypothetical protein
LTKCSNTKIVVNETDTCPLQCHCLFLVPKMRIVGLVLLVEGVSLKLIVVALF